MAADLTIWRNALPLDDCRRLVDGHTGSLGDDRGRTADTLLDLMVPELFLLGVAERLELDCTPETLTAQVVRYGPGADIEAHTDGGSQVNFTLLLNDGFEGGELLVGGEVVPLRPGDLVGFGPDTVHEVRPVSSGDRYVLVAWSEPYF